MHTCLVVLNIGERPFLTMTLPYFEQYCRRTDTDLQIVTEGTLSLPLRLWSKVRSGRRRNILAYLQKLKSVHDALGKHERVILMDDTCIVSPSTPDLVTIVPADAIGAFCEESLGVASFEQDKRFIQRRRRLEIARYPNTGMLVVSRAHRHVFAESSLWQNRDLLFGSPWPSQAYLAYMIARCSIPVYGLDERFNYMHVIEYRDRRNRELTSLPSAHVASRRDVHIHHLTGYYKHREGIIRQLCDHLSQTQGHLSEGGAGGRQISAGQAT